MAKDATESEMPVDTAPQIGPGLRYREAEFFADEGLPGMGFMAGFSGDTAIGAAKGNRSPTSLPAARPLTGDGPFANIRGSR